MSLTEQIDNHGTLGMKNWQICPANDSFTNLMKFSWIHVFSCNSVCRWTCLIEQNVKYRTLEMKNSQICPTNNSFINLMKFS